VPKQMAGVRVDLWLALFFDLVDICGSAAPMGLMRPDVVELLPPPIERALLQGAVRGGSGLDERELEC
jgi:hypothetical protein